jgi:predicted amidohydrolase YtcJ
MIYHQCSIVTVDDQRRMITDGALAVVDGVIAAAGKQADVIERFPDDERMALEEC